MNSRKFVDCVEERLRPFSPILAISTVKMELGMVGATKENLTPEQALKFINRVCGVFKIFLSDEYIKKLKADMLIDLRKYAPEYFKSR